MATSFWTVGCAYGASAVMLGAFGAHGLKARIKDEKRIANWGTAAQYQVRSPGVRFDIIDATKDELMIDCCSSSTLSFCL